MPEYDDMNDRERAAATLTFMKADIDQLRSRIRASLPLVEPEMGFQQTFVGSSLREQMIESHRVLRSLSAALDDFVKETF
ncbi:hypothetical protein E3_0370 [Rhodococcus phage E3]|uniref:hypothetical protein n=1 Tax=Rhodococcus phage E3 TaxID=1007869 RepID=UPI0002C6BB2E|nr:hypothetical protein M176_gp040 [Rhodococcus phage E3]AEQ20950.1 hypothetical protein E3_0370 [Rhodococcus phage E3]